MGSICLCEKENEEQASHYQQISDKQTPQQQKDITTLTTSENKTQENYSPPLLDTQTDEETKEVKTTTHNTEEDTKTKEAKRTNFDKLSEQKSNKTRIKINEVFGNESSKNSQNNDTKSKEETRVTIQQLNNNQLDERITLDKLKTNTESELKSNYVVKSEEDYTNDVSLLEMTLKMLSKNRNRVLKINDIVYSITDNCYGEIADIRIIDEENKENNESITEYKLKLNYRRVNYESKDDTKFHNNLTESLARVSTINELIVTGNPEDICSGIVILEELDCNSLDNNKVTLNHPYLVKFDKSFNLRFYDINNNSKLVFNILCKKSKNNKIKVSDELMKFSKLYTSGLICYLKLTVDIKDSNNNATLKFRFVNHQDRERFYQLFIHYLFLHKIDCTAFYRIERFRVPFDPEKTTFGEFIELLVEHFKCHQLMFFNFAWKKVTICIFKGLKQHYINIFTSHLNLYYPFKPIFIKDYKDLLLFDVLDTSKTNDYCFKFFALPTDIDECCNDISMYNTNQCPYLTNYYDYSDKSSHKFEMIDAKKDCKILAKLFDNNYKLTFAEWDHLKSAFHGFKIKCKDDIKTCKYRNKNTFDNITQYEYDKHYYMFTHNVKINYFENEEKNDYVKERDRIYNLKKDKLFSARIGSNNTNVSSNLANFKFTTKETLMQGTVAKAAFSFDMYRPYNYRENGLIKLLIHEFIKNDHLYSLHNISRKEWENEEIWSQNQKNELVNKSKKDLNYIEGKFDNFLALDDYNITKLPIMKAVNKKMRHERHILYKTPMNKCFLLGFYLYCYSDANYKLSTCLRQKDFKTWQMFDTMLVLGSFTLSCFETASTYSYSGLSNITFDENDKGLNNGRFFAHVSTSYDKETALKFLGNNGCLMEFDPNMRENMMLPCVDVTWISPFDEREILFCRSIGRDYVEEYKHLTKLYMKDNWIATVTQSYDENNKIQIVNIKSDSFKLRHEQWPLIQRVMQKYHGGGMHGYGKDKNINRLDIIVSLGNINNTNELNLLLDSLLESVELEDQQKMQIKGMISMFGMFILNIIKTKDGKEKVSDLVCDILNSGGNINPNQINQLLMSLMNNNDNNNNNNNNNNTQPQNPMANLLGALLNPNMNNNNNNSNNQPPNPLGNLFGMMANINNNNNTNTNESIKSQNSGDNMLDDVLDDINPQDSTDILLDDALDNFDSENT